MISDTASVSYSHTAQVNRYHIELWKKMYVDNNDKLLTFLLDMD